MVLINEGTTQRTWKRQSWTFYKVRTDLDTWMGHGTKDLKEWRICFESRITHLASTTNREPRRTSVLRSEKEMVDPIKSINASVKWFPRKGWFGQSDKKYTRNCVWVSRYRMLGWSMENRALKRPLIWYLRYHTVTMNIEVERFTNNIR